MSGKHTPGPWNLIWWGNERYPYPLSILADNDGAWIARDGTVSSEANARLIAAAPEMLEALKAFLAYDEQDGESDVEMMLAYAKARDMARAAIAKAEGEP